MTDLEMTKKCAEADRSLAANLYLQFLAEPESAPASWHEPYDPLHDDAQAMALVKKFGLGILHTPKGWYAQVDPREAIRNEASPDLNRAIVECVAKLPDDSIS